MLFIQVFVEVRCGLQFLVVVVYAVLLLASLLLVVLVHHATESHGLVNVILTDFGIKYSFQLFVLLRNRLPDPGLLICRGVVKVIIDFHLTLALHPRMHKIVVPLLAAGDQLRIMPDLAPERLSRTHQSIREGAPVDLVDVLVVVVLEKGFGLEG